MHRRKFRSQTSDNQYGQMEKQRWEESEKRKEEERRSEKRKAAERRSKALQNVEKSRNTVLFQCFGAPEGRRGGSLKWRVRSHLVRWEMRNCTPLWWEPNCEKRNRFGALLEVETLQKCTPFGSQRVKMSKHTTFGALLKIQILKNCTPLRCEAHLEVKMAKTHHVRSTFGSSDVEKVDAGLARSTLGSQNVKNTAGSEHFWKLRCWKSARRCGAKHISK